MTDPNTKAPILLSLLLRIDAVLERADSIPQSTSPVDKARFRREARDVLVMLRMELPSVAFDDGAKPIAPAANDPVRGEP